MRYAKIVLFGLRVNGSADSVMGRSMTAFVPAKWTRLSCWSPATELPDGFPVPFTERAEPSQPFGPSGCSRAVSGRRLCKPALRFRTRRMYRSEKRRKLPCEVRRQKKCLRHIRSAERPITVGRQAGDLFEQRAKELRGWKSQLLGDRTDGRFRGQESLPGYLHALEFDVCLRSLARFVLHHIREVCGR